MFKLVKVRDTVRVPPKHFGDDLQKSLLSIAQLEYEGLLDEDLGVVVAVTDAFKLGEGRVVLGDGAAYFHAEIEMLVFKPKIGEVVEGKISEITEFGAFLNIGPMEGLVHVSQIMDEYLNYDAKNACFVGKDTKRMVKVDDVLLARVVTVSLKGNLSESKLGLTMRQPFFGKYEWIEKEISDAKKGKKARKEKGKAEGKESSKGKKKKEAAS